MSTVLGASICYPEADAGLVSPEQDCGAGRWKLMVQSFQNVAKGRIPLANTPSFHDLHGSYSNIQGLFRDRGLGLISET